MTQITITTNVNVDYIVIEKTIKISNFAFRNIAILKKSLSWKDEKLWNKNIRPQFLDVIRNKNLKNMTKTNKIKSKKRFMNITIEFIQQRINFFHDIFDDYFQTTIAQMLLHLKNYIHIKKKFKSKNSKSSFVASFFQSSSIVQKSIKKFNENENSIILAKFISIKIKAKKIAKIKI